MTTNAGNKWRIRLAVLGIFLIGFAAGALALRLYEGPPESRGASGPRGRFNRVIEQLNLTPEQKTQVEAILSDARAQIGEIRKTSGPQFRDVRRRTDERLREVLTPEQWEQFQQLMSEGRGRRRRGPKDGDR